MVGKIFTRLSKAFPMAASLSLFTQLPHVIISYFLVCRHAGPDILQRCAPHPRPPGPLAPGDRGRMDGGLPPCARPHATWLRSADGGAGADGEPALLHTGHVAGCLPEARQGSRRSDIHRSFSREEIVMHRLLWS
jgi:hypothetical protein